MTTEPATERPYSDAYKDMLAYAGGRIGPPRPAPIREDVWGMIAVQERRIDALLLMLEYAAEEIDGLRQAQEIDGLRQAQQHP